jgi:hypothetical protein
MHQAPLASPKKQLTMPAAYDVFNMGSAAQEAKQHICQQLFT